MEERFNRLLSSDGSGPALYSYQKPSYLVKRRIQPDMPQYHRIVSVSGGEQPGFIP